MEPERAYEIISSLADGVNPSTGEIFPADNPYQHPDVVRALFQAQTALSREIRRIVARKELPDHAGKLWTDDEDVQLILKYEQGALLTELAATHKRTVSGVRSRLFKLGKLKPEDFIR